MFIKPRPLILPKRELYLPHERRKLPRPAPWIWIPKRFAPKAAVAFDAKATAVQTGTVATTSLTNSTLTVGASGSLVIASFCSVMSAGGTLPTPSSATWSGASMTAVANKTATDGLSNIYVYAIVSPTTGNKSCIVNINLGSGTVQVDLDCFSYSGTNTASVASCIPSGNVITDATTDNSTHYPTTAFTVTTVNGDAAVAVMNSAGTSYSNMAIGTIRNIENGGTVNYAAGDHLATSSSTQLQFGTLAGGGSTPCCGIAFDIAQPGGGDTLMSQSVM